MRPVDPCSPATTGWRRLNGTSYTQCISAITSITAYDRYLSDTLAMSRSLDGKPICVRPSIPAIPAGAALSRAGLPTCCCFLPSRRSACSRSCRTLTQLSYDHQSVAARAGPGRQAPPILDNPLASKQQANSSARNCRVATVYSRARRLPASAVGLMSEEGVSLADAVGHGGRGGVGDPGLQGGPDPLHRVVLRAVPGALDDLDTRMSGQPPLGDFAVVDGTVVTNDRDHVRVGVGRCDHVQEVAKHH